MTERMFRLLELYQKLDTAIRSMKTRPADPQEIARAMNRKRKLRDRLARLVNPPHLAPLSAAGL